MNLEQGEHSDGEATAGSPAAEELDSTDRAPRTSIVKATLWFSVVIFAVIVCAFDLFWNSIRGNTTADLRLALPLCQLAFAIVSLRLFGLPKSRREWGIVIVLHAFLIWNYWLIDRNLHGLALTYAVGLVFRLVIIGGWTILAVGTVTLLHVLVKGRSRHRSAGRVLKIAFATAVILLPLELASSVIDSRRNAPLPLIVDLPETPDLHIATIGGSTMLGFPYDSEYGIGRVVQWQLQSLYPERNFVLDNVAMTGINLEQAISRLNQASGFPDILIVYSGHNEFFHDTEDLALARRTHWAIIDDVARHSPLFRVVHRYLAQYAALPMPGLESSTVCGNRLCPEYVLRQRVQTYANHLRRLFGWAQSNNVKVVHCVPASGDTNLAPNVSTADGKANDDITERWNQLQSSRKRDATADSISAAKQAVAKYPQFAEFHYLLGLSLREAGESLEAQKHLVLARDLDQLPLRCLTAWQEAGVRVANEYSIPVVQSEEILRGHSADGVLDEVFFLDGVHPNLKATFTIADAVTDAIVAGGFVGETPVSAAVGTFPESLSELGVTVEVLVAAYSQTADVLEHYGFFRGFDNDSRIRQAETWARRAEQLKAGEIQPGEAGSESLTPR